MRSHCCVLTVLSLLRQKRKHMATFIFVTKFRFKLTSSSEMLIGSTRVQLPVRSSWYAFQFYLLEHLLCFSIDNIAREAKCQQHLQVELSSSKSMEEISLPLVWRVKAKSSSSYIPFLGCIGILSFRFKRFRKFAFHANNKTCLVLWIFCKMVFDSTTKTTPTFAFKRIKNFPLQGIDVSASWISFNRLNPRLSAHFMTQTISRSGLRKCEELPVKIMLFDLWKSQFSASWKSLVTDLLCRTLPVLLIGTNVFQMWRLLAGKICIQ